MVNRIAKLFLVFVTLAIVNSCHNKSEVANKNFLKQYGSEVAKINNSRIANSRESEQGNQSLQNNRNWQDPVRMFGISNTLIAKTAFIDTSKIVMPKPKEEFLPNLQTLLQNQSKSLPEGMFIISYNLENHPHSYRTGAISFDDIEIPNTDSFGIKTELGEKNYQLIGNQTLQRNIDNIKSLNSDEDLIASLELIKEKKRKQNIKYQSDKEIKNQNIKTDESNKEAKEDNSKVNNNDQKDSKEGIITPEKVNEEIDKLTTEVTKQIKSITNSK